MPIITKKIVKKIRELAKSGLGRQEIATKIGVDRNTVNHWLKNKHLPDDEKVYIREINKLKAKLEELGDDSIESKIKRLEKLTGSEKLLRAKAKVYKADEMLSELLQEEWKK